MNKFTIWIIIALVPLVLINLYLMLGMLLGISMGGWGNYFSEYLILGGLSFAGLICVIRIIVLIANKTLLEKKVFAIITLLVLSIPAAYIVSNEIQGNLNRKRIEENTRIKNVEKEAKIERTREREELCSAIAIKSLSNPDYMTNHCYDGRYGLNGEAFTNVWQWKGLKIETLDNGIITVEGRTRFYTGLDNPPSAYFFGSIHAKILV